MSNNQSVANPVNNSSFKSFTNDKEHLAIFKPIKYRNAKVDFGIILGERKGRWELKGHRKPTWAQSLVSRNYISETSPHKRDLVIYIPMAEVTVGEEILLFKENKYTKILITKKEDKTFGYKRLETWQNLVRKNHFPTQSYRA